MNHLVASSAAQVLFVFLFAPTLSNLGFAQAQTLTTLYNFQGPPADGMSPGAGILRDQDGNMYGTTSAGGQAENGTAFEVDASATETMLHSFNFLVDGINPSAPLSLGPGGALYGTTPLGGPNNAYGTVFRIRDDNLTVVYAFSGGLDGLAPFGGVVKNIDGNLYGTTSQGGTGDCPGGCGTIYQISSAGHETVVHDFDGLNGAYPGATLIHDERGNLYGTTVAGGNGQLERTLSEWLRHGLHAGSFREVHGASQIQIWDGRRGTSPLEWFEMTKAIFTGQRAAVELRMPAFSMR